MRRLAGRWRSRGAAPGPTRAPFAYEDAIDLLVRRGVREDDVRLSSIDEDAMRLVGETIARHAPRGPLRALHVGNFLGVSLAALSDILVRHDAGSVILSVDPNLSHLGIENPQGHVLALLDHFGLQRHNLVICAYSLDRRANETKVGVVPDEPAAENALESLARLGQRFDVAMLDGNHNGGYVRRELEVLVPMLSPGALVILDDVSDHFPDVRDLFEEVATDSSWPLERIRQSAHIGFLRRGAS
jgi:hypothetical protein